MFKSRSLSELKVFRHCNKDIPSSQSCRDLLGYVEKISMGTQLIGKLSHDVNF